ncbi:MAG TPA: sigma-70 family RNA polymerase sigma factor [Polyangiaceae bacterium]|nr:sigma-70 family RNA polymerase sigma factor [Polyangiaceae bacterium]
MGQRIAPRRVNLRMQALGDARVISLVVSGLHLVDRIARQLSRRLGAWLEYEELLSSGREGLFDAARRYEHARGAPFAAYASLRIRGAMLDSARRMAGLPRRTYERALAETPQASDDGETPTSCPRLKRPTDDGSEVALAARTATLTMVSDLKAFEESRKLAVTQDPESALERAELLALIRVGISALRGDEAELVHRHYFEDERLDDIAASLGITASWASRILSRAVARLTRQMRRKA